MGAGTEPLARWVSFAQQPSGWRLSCRTRLWTGEGSQGAGPAGHPILSPAPCPRSGSHPELPTPALSGHTWTGGVPSGMHGCVPDPQPGGAPGEGRGRALRARRGGLGPQRLASRFLTEPRRAASTHASSKRTQKAAAARGAREESRGGPSAARPAEATRPRRLLPGPSPPFQPKPPLVPASR